jgi:hypothetical protein
VKLGHHVIPYDPQFFLIKNLADILLQKIKKYPLQKNIDRAGKKIVEICETSSFIWFSSWEKTFFHPLHF